ncbi:cytochrome P450 [Streptomyces sp. H27-H1]|uniref:cytochrome P450 n=1 Tax=Streptomyces sp. H27-H1 TaxID=2996461 RepID=UPI00227163C8|nr:cytochrome P450 [Streptomyces sp. H27-H1]MCY0925333.1 cytochrome P450 [Streptomyces sp. H27-H1]
MEDSGTSTALIPLLERISLDADDATSRRVDLPDGSRVWLVGDYDDARTVLTDPRFSADDQIPGYPCLLPAPPRPGALSFLRMDAPQHGRVRRVLTPSFTMRRIEKMRPGIEDATRRLIEDMREEGPPVDLVDRFALPLPSLVICQLLGVPYEDHGAFQEHSRAFLSTDGTAEEATAALTALGDYIRTLALRRRTEPADDLLSTAVQQQEAAGMTDEDVVAMARLLLIAGHETTANMLGLSVLTLFEHPDQLSALRRDPALVKPAVEELLRHHSIVRTALGRVALADVLLPGGRTVRAGEGVVLGIKRANQDDRFLTGPGGDGVDIHREVRGHLSFGYGMHQCIGQTLARLELQVALTELLRAFPGLRAACPLEDIRVRHTAVILGLHTLPVAW